MRVICEILARGQDQAESAFHKGFRRRRIWPWGRAHLERGRRHGTNIAGAMEFLLQSAKRKTVCFVVSDFFDDGYQHAMRTASRKHDVIAVQVIDPREQSIPNVGLITLGDPETGASGLYDTGSAPFRQIFERLVQQRADELEKQFHNSGIDFIRIDSSGSVVDPLVKFLRLRERRMRR